MFRSISNLLLASLALVVVIASQPSRAASLMTTLGVGIGPQTCPQSGIGPGTCAGGSSPLGSCSASQGFFSRSDVVTAMNAAGVSLTTWKGAVDGLICGQVTNGTWAGADVEYADVAPTAALANLNLVSSSFTLPPGAGMSFTANGGWTGAATSTGYANTGYNPATSGRMTTNTGLIGVCVLNNRTTLMGNSFISELGAQDGTDGVVLDALTGSTVSQASIFVLGASTSSITATTTQIASTQGGFWVSRTAFTSWAAYYNGTQFMTANTSMSSLPSQPLYLLALNNSGSAYTNQGLADTIGGVKIGLGETAAQVEADEATFTTYLHAMGLTSNGC